MTTSELARGMLAQAALRLKTVEMAWTDGAYPYVVRSAQECCELALKALLIHAGFDPPKWHDVGEILNEARRRFKTMSQEDMDMMIDASRQLRQDRERSMYGDEASGLPPDRLFGRGEAEQARRWARDVLTKVQGILGGE